MPTSVGHRGVWGPRGSILTVPLKGRDTNRAFEAGRGGGGQKQKLSSCHSNVLPSLADEVCAGPGAPLQPRFSSPHS